MKTLLRLALLAGFVAVAAPAAAQVTLPTNNFDVTANVLSACQWVTAPGTLAFGDYDPLAAGDDTGTTTFALRCTPNNTYTITISYGANPSGTQRRMSDGVSSFLLYNLFSDAAFTAPWGTGAEALTGTSDATFAPAAGHTFTVYGVAPAAQFPAIGPHTDTVTVTVSYL